MPFGLLLVYLASSVGSNAFAKMKSQELTHASRAKYSLFMILNGILASFFFWMFGGFTVNVNLPTLIYALIYAVIVAAIIILGVVTYNMMNVSSVSVIRSGCGLVCTAIVGALLFSEEISLRTVLRIAVTFLSVIFVMLESKKQDAPRIKREKRAKTGTGSILLVIVLLLTVIFECANTVTIKYFTLDTRVADENSFFFLTNVFLVIGGAAVFAFECIRDRRVVKESIGIFKPRPMISIVGSTFAANIASLVSAWIIAQMDISVYTPVMSSIGIIAGFIGSLLYREKLGVLSYIAIAAAIVAVII